MRKYNHPDDYKDSGGWSINETCLILIVLGAIYMSIPDALFFTIIVMWVEVCMVVGVSGVIVAGLYHLIRKFLRK